MLLRVKTKLCGQATIGNENLHVALGTKTVLEIFQPLTKLHKKSQVFNKSQKDNKKRFFDVTTTTSKILCS